MNTIKNDDLSEFDEYKGYLLFYFTAKWCGPCQRIKPALEKLSQDVDSDKLKILMIDIDENEKLVNEFQIRSVPTFILYKDKNIQGTTNGADMNKIKELLKVINN
jgi:thioredoxin 1